MHNTMKSLLDQIEKSLKEIHYPLCSLEKYTFDYEPDEVDDQVKNIHKGYMEIQTAINKIRKLTGGKNASI